MARPVAGDIEDTARERDCGLSCAAIRAVRRTRRLPEGKDTGRIAKIVPRHAFGTRPDGLNLDSDAIIDA